MGGQKKLSGVTTFLLGLLQSLSFIIKKTDLLAPLSQMRQQNPRRRMSVLREVLDPQQPSRQKTAQIIRLQVGHLGPRDVQSTGKFLIN